MEIRNCHICGKEFPSYRSFSHHLSQAHPDVSNREYYDRFLKQPGDGVCRVCGKPTKFSGRLNLGYYIHCSKKCTAMDKDTVAKRKETNLSEHGTAGYNNHEKIERTKAARYGDKNYANGQRIRETKRAHHGIAGYNNPEKRAETKMTKYGDANFVNPEKCADTKAKLYNDPHYNNRKKSAITKSEKYSNPNFVNPEKARETVTRNTIAKYAELLKRQCDVLGYSDRTFRCRCRECGNEFEIPISTGYMRLFRYGTGWCTVCNPPETSRSGEEKSLFNFVEGLVGEGNVVSAYRELGFELDIYVPSRKLAIEFDGLYWHDERRKLPNYHLNKTEACEAAGIRLIHVFEDEWCLKGDIVKSRIAGILGKNYKIFARKCEVREIPYKESQEFLESNHIQGNCMSKWRYGLFLTGTLVAVMTFGRNRFDDGVELLRYCTLKRTNLVGGAGRLFKHFLREHPEISGVVSFADRRWSGTDAFYPKLGFELDGTTVPSYFYVISGVRHSRLEFTKGNLVKTGFDPTMSEHDIMLSRKIYRIYDCGNYKFVYSRFTDC